MSGEAVTLPADGVLRSAATVARAWTDAAGELRQAFCLKLFDDAGDALTCLAGMGEAYTRATHNSWVALESHLAFHAPAHADDELVIESCVLDLDGKKIHVYQAMYRADALLATHEQLGLHFNTVTRRGCPFEPAVHAALERLRTARAALPRPAGAGRHITLAAMAEEADS
ncbi:MAG: hotdog domain-containing protein [Gammaproteobacteria bacterium]